MLNLFAQAFIIFFPGWAANGMPAVGAKIPGLKRLYVPISPKILGAHKTYGGYGFAIAMGALLGYLWSFFFNPYLLHPALAGALFGAAAMIGDSLGSIIKRKIGYPPGETCWWLDFWDWLPPCWLVGYFLVRGFPLIIIPVSLWVSSASFIVSFLVTFTPFKENP